MAENWEQNVAEWLRRDHAGTGPRVMLACRHGHDLLPIVLSDADERLQVVSDTASIVSDAPRRSLDPDWDMDLIDAADHMTRSTVAHRRTDQLDAVALLLTSPEDELSQVWRCRQPGCGEQRIEVTRRTVILAYMDAATRGKKKSRLGA